MPLICFEKSPIQDGGLHSPLPHFFHNFSTQAHFTLKFWDTIQNLIMHESTK